MNQYIINRMRAAIIAGSENPAQVTIEVSDFGSAGWVAMLGLARKKYQMVAPVFRAGKRATSSQDDFTQVASGALAVLITALVNGSTWVAATDAMCMAIQDETHNDHEVVELLSRLFLNMKQIIFEEGDNQDALYLCDPSVIKMLTWEDEDDELTELTELTVEDKLSELEEGVARLVEQDADKLDYSSPKVILAKAMLICQAAQQWCGTPVERFRWAKTLAVSQNGSDTIANLVGNVLGAQLGMEAVACDKQDLLMQGTTPFQDLAQAAEAIVGTFAEAA